MADFVKDPEAVLDYVVNWLDWLGSDTIAASTFTCDTGITIDSTEFSTSTATVWLSGGTVGRTYSVTNHITTANNPAREEDYTFEVEIQEK